MSRHIDHEIHFDGLFVSARPLTHQLLLLFAKFVFVFSHEQASDVVVVFGGVKALKVYEVTLNRLHFFLTKFGLIIKFVWFLGSLSFFLIALRLYDFQGFEDCLFAECLDCFVGGFGVSGKYSKISG